MWEDGGKDEGRDGKLNEMDGMNDISVGNIFI